jgi:hypothetical protein
MNSTKLPPESQRTLVLAILCPHCGHNLLGGRGAWTPQSSSLLDQLLLLEESVHALRVGVEAEVLA